MGNIHIVSNVKASSPIEIDVAIYSSVRTNFNIGTCDKTAARDTCILAYHQSAKLTQVPVAYGVWKKIQY
jgi:hypothetical protein